MAAEEAALQERTPQEREAYSRLLCRVRDEIMAPDPKGEAYIRLAYRYAPEVTALLLEGQGSPAGSGQAYGRGEATFGGDGGEKRKEQAAVGEVVG